MKKLFAIITFLLILEKNLYAAEAGMPQLDPEYWPSQIFWLIIIFFTIYILISKIFIPKIKGKITFYPHCGILNLSQKFEWRTRTPSLVFLADQDGFGLATQPSDCIDLFESFNEKEKHIDYYLMENSTHVFDSEFYIRRGIVYNKEATDFAKNKIISFIKSSGSKDN